MNREQTLRALVSDTLSEKRARHVFAVARETEALCAALGVSESEREGLISAALLHDITKEKSTEEQLQMCARCGIILSDSDKRVPKALHAITGAYLAKHTYALEEPFCEAIRFHTTGRVGMSVPDKILFLADYIEDTRTYPTCVALRRVFWSKIEQGEDAEATLTHAVRLGLDMTLQDLLEEGRFIHPDTVSARNDLL